MGPEATGRAERVQKEAGRMQLERKRPQSMTRGWFAFEEMDSSMGCTRVGSEVGGRYRPAF